MVGWCDVLDKLSVWGVLLIWIGQGPTALAVGADGRCLDIFSLSSIFSLLSLSLSLFGRRHDID